MRDVEPTPPTTSLVITTAPLSASELTAWATRANCGAVITFCGTVRDVSDDRDDIEALEYETDTALALERLSEISDVARARWPSVVAIAIHHRLGRVALTESSVVVVVAAPHRADAFDAARFCIDTLKTSVPIYKRDVWSTGSRWSSDVHVISDVSGN